MSSRTVHVEHKGRTLGRTIETDVEFLHTVVHKRYLIIGHKPGKGVRGRSMSTMEGSHLHHVSFNATFAWICVYDIDYVSLRIPGK